MAWLLDGDLSYVDVIIRESVKLYMQESVQKGYTLPLTGFQEKFQTNLLCLEIHF